MRRSELIAPCTGEAPCRVASSPGTCGDARHVVGRTRWSHAVALGPVAERVAVFATPHHRSEYNPPRTQRAHCNH